MVLRRETRKKKFFLLHELMCSYCANSTKKTKKFFLLHELVRGLINRAQEKKICFFTARTRSKAREKLLPYICQEKKLTFCIMRKKKIFILLQEFNETASCSYCANSIFFFKMHELYPKLVKFILSTSITDIKKKKPFWLCQQSKQNWLYCTN